jgi:hypothetical protein
MDERDLPKAPLSLFHIIDVSIDVGDDEWTGRGWRNCVEEEVEKQRDKFQIHNFNQVQPLVNPRD